MNVWTYYLFFRAHQQIWETTHCHLSFVRGAHTVGNLGSSVLAGDIKEKLWAEISINKLKVIIVFLLLGWTVGITGPSGKKQLGDLQVIPEFILWEKGQYLALLFQVAPFVAIGTSESFLSPPPKQFSFVFCFCCQHLLCTQTLWARPLSPCPCSSLHSKRPWRLVYRC